MLFFFLILFLCVRPAQANADYDQGVAAYQTRDYRGAIGRFALAQRKGYQVSACMYYQALCWQGLGEMNNARQVFEEIMRLYPGTAAAEQSRLGLESLNASVLGGGTAHSGMPYTAPTAPASPSAPNPNDWYLGYRVIAEIPFTDTDEGMVVTTLINGKQVPAMWDTGAAGMHFDKSQLEKYGVDLSKARNAGYAMGIGGTVPAYEFDAVVQLGRQSERLAISFVDDSVAEKNNERSISRFGLIGEEFFGKYAYEVDPFAQRIRLLRKTSVNPLNPKHQYSQRSNPYSKLGEPFRWEDGHIYVTVRVNGRECEMIFDTGAASIAFTDKQLIGIGMTLPTNSGSGRSYGVGGSRASYWFKLKSLEFGPSSSHDVETSVVVHGSHPAPLLGESYLRHLRYIIDPELQIIRIRKAG